MNTWLLYMLIVVAIAIGWWLGRRERIQPQVSQVNKGKTATSKYYQGLNYLLKGEPDHAMAIFIESLEVNASTLETHLALGGLLRRRGELEKAIVVHQNILTQTDLNQETVLNVQLELARDYLLAGLLDRAEGLLIPLTQGLSEGQDYIRREGLKLMLVIYEREKEWHQAIAIGQLLASGEDTEKYEQAISHYYCEIALHLIAGGDISGARQAISDAIGHDAKNPRVSLVQGGLEFSQKNYREAIRCLQRIKDQGPIYVPESLELLRNAYEGGQSSLADFRQYLLTCLETRPSISIVLTLAEQLRKEQDDRTVAKFIANYLKQNPTIRGLTQLIDLHIDHAEGVSQQNLLILRSFSEALVADKPAYRCHLCGFEGKKMRWHCPSCQQWGSIEPIVGLEGE